MHNSYFFYGLPTWATEEEVADAEQSADLYGVRSLFGLDGEASMEDLYSARAERWAENNPDSPDIPLE